MDTLHHSPRVSGPSPLPGQRPDGAAPPGRWDGALWRWLPAATALLVTVAALVATDTALTDIAKYAFYAVWGVVLPGTLVFRSLRRRPFTLVEDLALGAVTGLVLELVAWAVFMALGIGSVALLWPLAVVIPFAAIPGLRRHWRVSGYTKVPVSWSWAVSGTVALTTGYLYKTYLARNPILPTGDGTRQFLDIPYQMSLAGNAKHNFPLTLPQVSGEPLEYHWFSFVHEAMTSMVGHIDLPVVQLRLMLPALCALTMVVTAVVAWRLSGRAWAGPVAALLIFAIGEFNGTPAWTPFGSPQTTLMVWASISMTYSQPLLLALIAVAGEGLRRRAADDPIPAFGSRAVYVLVAMFALASCAAKATSIPVALAGLALAGLVVLIQTRRIPWAIVIMGALVGATQFFSLAVIFRFKSYGLEVAPFSNLERSWADPDNVRSSTTTLVVASLVVYAFLLNTQLRMAGAIPLMWRSRMKLDAVQWFLLGGTVAGPAVYLLLNGWNSSYFTHAGLAFGVLLSAWGYAEAFDRAKLSKGGKWALGTGSVAFVLFLSWAVVFHGVAWQQRVNQAITDLGPGRGSFLKAFVFPGPGAGPGTGTASGLTAMIAAGLLACAAAAVGAVVWWLVSKRVSALRGRGGIIVLTGALLLGTPTLVNDLRTPGYDPTVWGSLPLPAGKVNAARWVRSHSAPADVIATNEHCWSPNDWATPQADCPNRQAFVLSGYSERSVLVEGWAFAPRVMGSGSGEFWDQELLAKNDAAFTNPTPGLLAELRDEHGVRYLFVNRRIAPESPRLGELAGKVFDNGRIGIYELR